MDYPTTRTFTIPVSMFTWFDETKRFVGEVSEVSHHISNQCGYRPAPRETNILRLHNEKTNKWVDFELLATHYDGKDQYRTVTSWTYSCITPNFEYLKMELIND